MLCFVAQIQNRSVCSCFPGWKTRFDLSSHGSRWDTMTHPPSSPSKFTGASNTAAPTHKCSLLHAPTWIPASVLSEVGGGVRWWMTERLWEVKVPARSRDETGGKMGAAGVSLICSRDCLYFLYLLMETDDNRMTPTSLRFLTHICEGTHLDWVTHDNGGQ